jgi:hypothetical protein
VEVDTERVSENKGGGLRGLTLVKCQSERLGIKKIRKKDTIFIPGSIAVREAIVVGIWIRKFKAITEKN